MQQKVTQKVPKQVNNTYTIDKVVILELVEARLLFKSNVAKNKCICLINHVFVFRLTLINGQLFGPLKFKSQLFEASSQALNETIMIHGTRK